MNEKKILSVFGLIILLLLFSVFPQMTVQAESSDSALSIDIDDGVETVIAGTSQKYTITVENNSPLDEPVVLVSCKLPEQATNSPDPAPWRITTSSGGVTLGASGSDSGTVSVITPPESVYLTVVSMPAGSSFEIEMTVGLQSRAEGSFPVEVSLNEQFSDTDTDAIEQEADISVTVTNSNTSMNPRGSTTFFVTATNNGPSDVMGATLSCKLPDGTVSGDWSFSSYNTGGAYASPFKGTGDLETTLHLPAGTSYPFWYSVTASADAAGAITATASLSSPVTDLNPENDTAACSVALVQDADLSVGVDFGDQTGNLAGIVTYDVVVANNGPSPTTNVILSVPLPAGITVASIVADTDTSYDRQSGIWTVGSLGNGEYKLLTFKVSPDYATNQEAAASVLNSDMADSNNENNSDSLVITERTDLAVAIGVDDTNPDVGNEVTYTLTATNNGPVKATNVFVDAVLPKGLTYVSDDSDGRYDAEEGWYVGSLKIGTAKTITINATVTSSDDQTFEVTARADQPDSDVINNSAAVTISSKTTDLVAPVIELAGDNPMTIEVHGIFSDPGAVVTDNIDTGLVAVAAGAVNTDVLGTYTVTYTATDRSGNTATATRTISVVDTTAPTIVLDGDNPMTISFGSIYTEPGASVTDNYDAELKAVATGKVITTTAGTYTVTYTATDSSNNTARTARTVIVKANHAPTTVKDSYSTNKGTALTIAAPGVLGNDTDADGNGMTVVKTSKPYFGKLIMNSNGSFSYTPDKYFFGTDSFRYYASDGTSYSNAATVTIKVVRVINHAPEAVNDSYRTNKNTTLRISAPGVLGNDTDVDGNSLRAILAIRTFHGKLTLNPDGSFSYTPDKNFVGTDSFRYFVSDGNTYSNLATATINVVKP